MGTLRERLITALGGKTPAEFKGTWNRAYEAGFNDSGEDEPPSGDLKTLGYRSSTGGLTRDLSGLSADEILDIVWKIYLSSPVAKRYLQVKRDYELGRGIEPTTEDEALGAILDDFWAINKLRHRSKQYAIQLHLLGEQCYPVFVRETDGRVRLGYIDPVEIEQVITHPDNVLEKWAVVLKTRSAPADRPWVRVEGHKRVFRIIREDESVAAELGVSISMNEGRLVTAEQATQEDWEADMLKAISGGDAYDGSCFYFSRNDLSNQARGYSDLLQVADWLDQDDEVLFALADRENMAGFFNIDVTVEGGQEVVAERADWIRKHPPKKGSVNVHNSAEVWKMDAPDLKQQPSIETHNALLTFNLGGLGLPRHWYGHGDETNRATAQAQGDPTWRTMEHDQDEVRDMFMTMLTFAKDQAAIAGREVGDSDIDLTMPEMTSKDLVSISTAATGLATALMTAQDQGWMSRERSAEAWAKLMAEFDIEIDPQEELAAVDGEQEQGALDDHSTILDSWRQAHGTMVAEPEPMGMM
jgi:hypothetical protein